MPEDISEFEREHFSPAWIERLEKILPKFKDGERIWWSRKNFHRYDNKPKMHILKSRNRLEPDQDSDFYRHRYVAKCGYEYDFLELLGWEVPLLRISAPAKIDRCKMCVIEDGK